MKHAGIEQVIARTLLTDTVLEHLLNAGEVTVDEGALAWKSWPQVFGSTTGPWGGFGGAAMTTFQVTVAVDQAAKLVLVFAGTDLFAYGWSDESWFWEQERSGNINTDGLARFGLTVLDRRLP